MPARTAEEGKLLRQWIQTALDKGMDSPRAVLEYLEQNADIDPPTISTVGNIMKEFGYAPLGVKWVKKGKTK
jgi:hypothetical protein